MRRLTTVLLTATLLIFGFASGAAALSVEPATPPGADFIGSDGTEGVIAIRDVDPENLMFQLVEVMGSPGGVKVQVVARDGSLRLPSKLGTHFGTGVNVADGRIEDGRVPGSKAVFTFNPFALGEMATDVAKIGYGPGNLLEIGDRILFDIFDRENALIASGIEFNVVPEPGTALLLGMGMTGLALAGRRRS